MPQKIDEARDWTDKKLEQMEEEISKIYKKSAKEIIQKWDDFMSKSAEKVSRYQKAYNRALKSGDPDKISAANKNLQDAITRQTIGNSYYQSKVDEITTQLSQVNSTALAYVNDQMPSVYTQNFNFIDSNTSSILALNDIEFNLVSEAVVKRRILDGTIALPKKAVNIPRDKRWNTKQLNSAVLQGILQGESMADIAKRILPIVDNNKVSAMRNARTMVTTAENQGRLDRYKDLAEKGVVMHKIWMATGDDRTRAWHLSMDGQEKDLDEPFIDDNGKELMMPGDPKGPANSVYNCRCTTKSKIIGFKRANGTISYVADVPTENTSHASEIATERARRKK